MKPNNILSVLAWTLPALSNAALVQVESMPSVPSGWTLLRSPSPDHMLKLRIALVQPGKADFEAKLYDISDPDSPNYGAHLKRHESRAMLAPAAESSDAVLAWLRDAGVEDAMIENRGDWINFRVPVSKAEELLGATFGVYRYNPTGKNAIRTLAYSVPEEVRDHLTLVQPTTRFGDFGAMRSTIRDRKKIDPEVLETMKSSKGISTLSSADGGMVAPEDAVSELCDAELVTADCLRALYRIGDMYAPQTDGVLFGVAGYLEQWAKYDQLELFLEDFAPYAAGHNFSTTLINGGENNQEGGELGDDIEANLDIQYAASLGFDNNLMYYSTGGRGPLVPDLDQPTPDDNFNEPYMEFFEYMLDLPDGELPQTLTTSYGESEQSIPPEYAKKVCSMISELGARGVTVLFSSGDSGPGSTCQSNDGLDTPKFNPSFPGACPFLTSVGGTQNFAPEEAWPHSQGGFSNYFPTPDYQSDQVAAFLAASPDATEFAAYFNASGRGFPDIAAGGSNYAVYEYGQVYAIGGTSASSPCVASMVSLINAALVKDGKAPLGFMNPWLYKTGVAGLKDIVDGRSTGCTGQSPYSGLNTTYIPNAGWSAIEGWDPVTGLGTVLFDQLLPLACPNAALPTF